MAAFYLKKLIGMWLMPIPLTLSGLLLALFLWKRRPRLSQALVAFSCLWLALTSWHPVADKLLAPFENHYPMFDRQQPVDAVVVLGGCHASDATMPPAAQLCTSSLFRLVEGLRILEANPQALLFVSGYKGTDKRAHAEVMQEVAESFGVDSKRIRSFSSPRDTEEEAMVMQPYLKDLRFALVTENSHLPRALVFFEALNLNAIAAPAMRMSVEDSDWRIGAQAAQKTERAMYELLGTLWQKLKGSKK